MDVTAIFASMLFDCDTRTARAEASLSFRSDDRPLVFDLRQRIRAASLDGHQVDPEALASGADGVRRIEVPVNAGDHELNVVYDLQTPACTDAQPLGWTQPRPGIVFDLWMSDLHPGRYLEMWVPAPLCDDRFRLILELEVTGAGRHQVFANGLVDGATADRHRVTFPSSYTSLSPMLLLTPEERYDLLVTEEAGLTVQTVKLAGPEIDLHACHETVVRCLAHNRSRFGPYIHGDRFLTYVWGSSRGMEYDGATTTSPAALEHEVFHSWFGRGVKPACASDGWIDEAFTTWYTAAAPRPRQWAQPFDWSEPPGLLRPPSVLDRYTPRQAYSAGARFFAGIAAVLGVDGLCDAMGALYRERRGGFLSTDDLERHLSGLAGWDLEQAFSRWVHGREPSR